MFGRHRKNQKHRVVHTPECTAIHEAVLMSLYFGFGAPSAPLFVPSGGLVCTCDQHRNVTTEARTESDHRSESGRNDDLVAA